MATSNDLPLDGLFEELAIHSSITFFTCVSNKYEHLVIRPSRVVPPLGHTPWTASLIFMCILKAPRTVLHKRTPRTTFTAKKLVYELQVSITWVFLKSHNPSRPTSSLYFIRYRENIRGQVVSRGSRSKVNKVFEFAHSVAYNQVVLRRK